MGALLGIFGGNIESDFRCRFIFAITVVYTVSHPLHVASCLDRAHVDGKRPCRIPEAHDQRWRSYLTQNIPASRFR